MLLPLLLSALLATSSASCGDGPGFWCMSCENVEQCSFLLDGMLAICQSMGLLTGDVCASNGPLPTRSTDRPDLSESTTMPVLIAETVPRDYPEPGTDDPFREYTDSPTEAPTADEYIYDSNERVGPTEARRNTAPTPTESRKDLEEEIQRPEGWDIKAAPIEEWTGPTKTCTIFGDPHLVTYDGKEYSFQGECSYVLSMDGGKKRSWIIYGQFMECGPDVSCLTSVTLYYDRSYLMLDRGWTANYQGSNVRLRLGENIYAGGAAILFDGLYTIVTLPNKMKVYWNGLRNFHIVKPDDGVLTSIGLCGNADGNRENDWIPRNAQPDPETGVVAGVDFYQFIDSWKIDRSGICPGSRATSVAEVCKGETKGREVCKKIFSGFSLNKCKAGIGGDWWVEQCTLDWCGAQSIANVATQSAREMWAHEKAAECNALAAFVKHCGLTKVDEINEFWWRGMSECPSMNVTQQYTLLDGIAPWDPEYDGWGGQRGGDGPEALDAM